MCACQCVYVACVHVPTFITVCITEGEAASLFGTTGGHPELPSEHFCRRPSQCSGAPQNSLRRHCHIHDEAPSDYPPPWEGACACVTKLYHYVKLFSEMTLLLLHKTSKAIFLHPEQASDNLPENTAMAIFHLCLDVPLGNALPSVQETAVAYLEQVNSDSYDLYRRVSRAALWMESTCNFLKEAQAEVWSACHFYGAIWQRRQNLDTERY